MSFGSNLENLRKQKGWSQDKLADKLHISRQAISKWENGTSKPDIDNVKSISNIFSIGIDELLDNELPDRAAKLDVEKEEKKENVIQVIKYMIIAVVLIYLISVIGKFISLLTIVNGIQKYANLDNYHYVITTYEDNKVSEKEETWYNHGMLQTNIVIYHNPENYEKQIMIDFNNQIGYSIDENNQKTNIDLVEYLMINKDFDKGAQMYSKFPENIKKKKISDVLSKTINLNKNIDINEYETTITINFDQNLYILDKNKLVPILVYTYEEQNDIATTITYSIELNSNNLSED